MTRAHKVHEALTAITYEGGGLFDVTVWSYPQLMVHLADCGPSPMNWALLQGLKAVRKAMAHPKRRKRPMCLTCETVFSRRIIPALYVQLSGMVDAPTVASLQLVCSACADQPDLEGRMLASFRKHWSDMRAVDRSHLHREPGTA